MLLQLLPELQEVILNYCSCDDIKNLACTSTKYNKALQEVLFHTIKVPPMEQKRESIDDRSLQNLELTKCLDISLEYKLNWENLSNDIQDNISTNCANILKYSNPCRLYVRWSFISSSLSHAISKLDKLTHLNLHSCTGISDIDILYGGLDKLQTLDLGYSSVTDEELVHLQKLVSLEELVLHGCKMITDAGFGYIAVLPTLRKLDIRYCKQITDAAFAHIGKLVMLRELDISYCSKVTDEGLFHLRGLLSLEKFNAYNCNEISDVGVSHIAALTALQKLSLNYCHAITDEGLIHLKNLTKLKELGVDGCYLLTDAGVSQLHEMQELEDVDAHDCSEVTYISLNHFREKVYAAMVAKYMLN